MLAMALPPTGDVRSLCWRSAEQLNRLCESLRVVLDSWARDWGLCRPAVTLDNAWQAHELTEVAWQPTATNRDGEVVAWLGRCEPEHVALERLLFGVAPDVNVSTSLARSLAVDALAALRRGLAKWLDAAPPSVDMVNDVPLEADGRPWSGAVRANITLGEAAAGVSFALHVRANAWPRPGRAGVTQLSRAPGLEPMSGALAAQPLKLHARLADVHVSLGELIGLREGDVLVTSHRLIDQLAITSPEGECPTVFRGRLVQRQGLMAVSLMQPR